MRLAITAPILVIAINLLALGGFASAHTVTSVIADCERVRVYVHDFPEAGVMVHIAVDVEGQATISRDVLVTSATTEVDVDISPATQALHGATADVDVDVTWTLWGAQHVHETRTVTCGSATTEASTTTTIPEATTTLQAEASTTTTIPEATTTLQTEASTATTIPEATTTLQIMGATSSLPVRSTTKAVGSFAGTGPPITSLVPAAAVLPRTGFDSSLPPVFGLSCLIAGCLLLLRRSRVWPS